MLFPKQAEKYEKQYPIDPGEFGHIPQIINVKNKNKHILNGWLFSTSDNYGTIMVGGGNAMGLSHTYNYNRHLISGDQRVFIISYQGFGKNEGKPDLDSMIDDINSFHEWIEKQYPKQPIVFIGGSISAVAGLCAESKYKLFNGLIVEGVFNPKTIPYSKATELWYLFPVTFPLAVSISLSVPDTFDLDYCLNREKKNIPILFIHHTDDKLTPYDEARSIFENYNGEKFFYTCKNTASLSNFHFNIHSDTGAKEAQINFINKLLNQ